NTYIDQLGFQSFPTRRSSDLIDLCRLGLDAIEETDEQFTLGAMVTLRQIEQHAGLAAYTQGASVRAVRDIVGVQFRNMATLGGRDRKSTRLNSSHVSISYAVF